MHNRLRLLRLTTGLLYFGPLLAGLMGQGWSMVPVFVGVFLLSSVIVHPELWPMPQQDQARSETAVALASLIATQVLLVVVCFAFGRGIGGVLALKPALPACLPAAQSFLAVLLARLVWPPEAASRTVEVDPAAPDVSNRPLNHAAAAEAMLARLMALGDDVTEDVVQHHLSAIADHTDPVILRQALSRLAAGRGASLSGIKALIVHATDPAVSDLLSGSAYPAQAFAAAGRNPELLTLFARRCLMALGDEPDLAVDCPTVAALGQAAQEVCDTVAASALNRLAGFLEQTSAPAA